MNSKKYAFDDFLDDCFVGQDTLCQNEANEPFELIASEIISELILQEDVEDLAA